MTEDESTSAFLALAALGTPTSVSHVPMTGAMYLEEMGGPKVSSYWPGPTVSNTTQPNDIVVRQRAELFLVATSLFALMRLYARPSSPGRQQDSDVAFLYFLKGFAQATQSINLLSSCGCYSDALSIVRSVAGRVNLLALFALGPHLFDAWLKSPRENRFLDGHVRQELANHRITIFPHFYEHFSESIHGQHQALEEQGYLTEGLFPQIVALENQVLVATKLLFGAAQSIGLFALELWPRPGISADLPEAARLFSFVREELLPPGRWDHLFATTAKERHRRSNQKGEAVVGEWLDHSELRRQMELFGRASRPKDLGKAYRVRGS